MTDKAGLRDIGWAYGVCVGDYNNDGFEDLFCTYWGALLCQGERRCADDNSGAIPTLNMRFFIWRCLCSCGQS